LFSGYYTGMPSGASTMVGQTRKKKKRGDPTVGVTEVDPNRAEVGMAKDELEANMSEADRKKKRRQRAQRGANPFTRGATVLG